MPETSNNYRENNADHQYHSKSKKNSSKSIGIHPKYWKSNKTVSNNDFLLRIKDQIPRNYETPFARENNNLIGIVMQIFFSELKSIKDQIPRNYEAPFAR
eukprot:6126860-Amphidinium_carterae.1